LFTSRSNYAASVTSSAAAAFAGAAAGALAEAAAGVLSFVYSTGATVSPSFD